MNPAYKAAAYRRTIFEHLQRILLGRCVDGSQPATEQLYCEQVFFADRIVPQDALLDVLDTLQDLEERERKTMNRFDMRERDAKGTDGSTDTNPQQPSGGDQGGAVSPVVEPSAAPPRAGKNR